MKKWNHRAAALLMCSATLLGAVSPYLPSEAADVAHEVTLKTQGGGEITLDTGVRCYAPGDTVVIDVSPQMMNTLDSASVTGDSGQPVSDLDESQYPLTFVMPDEDVVVSAQFRAITQADRAASHSALDSAYHDLGSRGFQEAAAIGTSGTGGPGRIRRAMAAPASVTITENGAYYYQNYGYYSGSTGNMISHRFTSGSLSAYCLEPMVTGITGSKTYSAKNASIYEVTDSQVLSVLYHAYGNPGDLTGQLTQKEGARYILSHLALAKTAHERLAGFGGNQWSAGTNSKARNLAQSLINLSVQAGIPSDMEVHAYIIDPKANSQKMIVLKVKPIEKKGSLSLVKVSEDPASTDGNPDYSLGDASYEVYADSAMTQKVGTLVTDESGRSNTLMLDVGTYFIKEVSPSKGFAVDTKTHNVEVTWNGQASVTSVEKPEKASVKIRKSSEIPSLSAKLHTYSLKGAEYGLFRKADHALAATIVTVDDAGNSEAVEVPFGDYYLKETKAPAGFLRDGKVYDASLHGTNEVEIAVSDQPGYDTPELLLMKRDAETDGSTPIGEASLAGAKYTVKYYDVCADHDPAEDGVKPNRTWVFQTDDEGRIRLTKDYLVSQNPLFTVKDHPVLPLGTYTFRETKAPKGYLADPKTYVAHAGITDNKVVTTNLPATNHFHSKDQVIRGDFRLRKVDANTQKAMGGISFDITSKATGETHRITVDDNGEYSSASSYAKHTNHTNRGEAGDGLWFTGKKHGKADLKSDAKVMSDTQSKSDAKAAEAVDDSLGALPYGTYEIREVPGEKNRGKKMYQDTFTISKNGAVIELGNIANHDVPSIHTEARDPETGNRVGKVRENAEIIDRISYHELTPGETYTVHGILMDASTGKPYTAADGRTIEVSKTFKTSETDGAVEVTFRFDATGLDGHALVVFEDLEYQDQVIADHKDLTDDFQMIHYPKKPETPKTLDVPKTGDANLALFVILAFAAVLGIVLIRRREKV